MNQLTILSQAISNGRRSFLLRSASTLAFPLALAGCGGGGGSGGSNSTGTGGATTPPIVALTRSNAKGTLALPAGATVKVTSVENAFGSSAPAADGSFDFVSVAESEMFAVALGPGGKMVLCGLLQAGAAQLSARSTAVCLAYTALGVGVYLPATQQQYLAAMQASPTLAGLEAAVAAAIVARGEAWLDLGDPALKSAVAALQQALSPTALGGASAAQARARILGATQPGSDGRAVRQGMVIDKTDRVSGLQLSGDGVGSITLTNYYRRRSYAYVERVSYKNTFDGAAIASLADVGAQPVKVDATKSITNTLVTLAQLLGGTNDFYDPVVYPGIATPIAPDNAALTSYRVTSVGLGVHLGDLALLTPVQHVGLLNVLAETFVLDIAVPIFCGILIPLRAAPMKTFVEELAVSGLKDMISTLAAADDFLFNKIVAANLPLKDVLWDALLQLVNSDSLKTAFLQFFQRIIDSLSVDGVLPRTNVVNVGAKALLDALSALDLAAQTMDMVAVGLSFAFSDLADRFAIDVTKSVVRINPLNPLIDNNPQPTSFSLSVIGSDFAAGDLSYKWDTTNLFGDVGTSSDLSVLHYSPKGNAKGGDQDVVTGTVFIGNPSVRVPIGKATSTITYSTVITPSPLQLLINTRQTFTADISARLLASGTALRYVWTLTGSGSIGGTAVVTTSTPAIDYTAPSNAGTDSLALSVTDAAGTVITRGSVSITVLGSIAVGIAPQNPQVPRSTVLNFVVNPSGAPFPDGTTFKWVLTGNLDLFGHPTDLGGSGGGLIGVSATPPASSGASVGNTMTVVTTRPAITFAANPFGPEAVGDAFSWYPRCVLTVSVLNASGNVLATSSTPIQTQLPHGILLP